MTSVIVFPGSTPADQVRGVIGAFADWLSEKSVNVAHDELKNLDSTNAKFNAEADVPWIATSQRRRAREDSHVR